jgi:dsRNA-specific ribonuclease
MINQQKIFFKKLLLDPRTDFNQKIVGFIKIFNADSFYPDLQSGKWNVSKEEWQRYEFLGDRVLDLVASDFLFHQSHSKREGKVTSEGEMTRMMGVVSNESLSGMIECQGIDIALLIPESIGQQQTYGERVKGGALEAFFGTLYEIVGFEVTRTVILSILSEEIEKYDPATNYIGRL